MGILDLSRAKARTVTKYKRLDCHNYEGAYAYLQNNHEDWANANAKKTTEHPWVKVNEKTGETTLEITLHAMPLYWAIDETGKKRTIYAPVEPEAGQSPNASKKERRVVDEIIGLSKYQLESYEEGVEIAKKLMSEEDADFKEILTRAAEALKEVDETELPDIDKQARYWYTFTDSEKTFGAWDDKDKGTRTSDKKQQKKNSCKATARNQLGYARKAEETISYR